MTEVDPSIVAARAEVERTRTQLIDTARELQNELLLLYSPHTLARDIWEGAKDKGADLAEDAVDAVRARPLAAGGALAALTLFIAREPLLGLAVKLFGSKKRTEKPTVKKGRKPAAKVENKE